MTLALVFPGQGSQSVGMLSELNGTHSVVGETFEEASESVGVDLLQLALEGPEADLNSTENTQPALLAAGTAVWRVWKALGGETPEVLAGHSLGEYTALVAAGVMSLSDGARLVAQRGRYMQDAVPAGTGAMAAIIGLDDDQVSDVCEAASQGGVVSAANLNSPGQVVIAGDIDAVDRAVKGAIDAGARRAIPLAVSVPSHCELMRPAAERLAEDLEHTEFMAPRIPVLHNADVECHQDVDKIRNALVRQLFQPVRWVESVQAIAGMGVTRIHECGPGKVLAGLIRRIDRGLTCQALVDSESIKKALV